MSLIIKGMKLPKHADVNGEKDTAYRCIILAHPDNSVELVIDTEFTSAYDNGHNIQRYPLAEIPTPHGRLIDADILIKGLENVIAITGSEDRLVFVNDVIALIKNLPAIIEAEGADE